jgi:hypothetical protein
MCRSFIDPSTRSPTHLQHTLERVSEGGPLLLFARQGCPHKGSELHRGNDIGCSELCEPMQATARKSVCIVYKGLFTPCCGYSREHFPYTLLGNPCVLFTRDCLHLAVNIAGSTFPYTANESVCIVRKGLYTLCCGYSREHSSFKGNHQQSRKCIVRSRATISSHER